MIYYRLKLKLLPDEDRSYPYAVANKIPNSEDLLKITRDFLPEFEKPFDYFELGFLSGGKEKDKVLLEAYDFLGPTAPMWENHLFNFSVFQIFQSSALCSQTKFYPALLKVKKEKLNYYIIHSIYHYTLDVDFSRSKFGYIKADHGEDHGKVTQEFSLSNIDEWKEKYHSKPKLTRFRPTVLAMKTHFDAFLIEALPGWIVSQTLKDKLLNAGFQRFEFEEIQNIHFI